MLASSKQCSDVLLPELQLRRKRSSSDFFKSIGQRGAVNSDVARIQCSYFYTEFAPDLSCQHGTLQDILASAFP